MHSEDFINSSKFYDNYIDKQQLGDYEASFLKIQTIHKC